MALSAGVSFPLFGHRGGPSNTKPGQTALANRIDPGKSRIGVADAQ